jgi:ubiquinone/menaquinone biosynthesis C-methylase UbiE
MASVTTAHGWQLQQDSANAYERYLVPLLFEVGARHLLDSVRIGPGQRVLDVACGTGIVARTAVRRVGPSGEVTGVDLNPDMLAVAREVSAREVAASDAAPIRWVEASADELPLAGASVDVACCQQGLQFLADRAAALAELHRVLTPGGRLGLSTCRPLEHQPGYVPLVEALRHHVGESAAAGMASPFAFGDRQEIRSLVAEAGFRDVEVRIEVWPVRLDSPEAFLRGESASSPLGGVIAALDGDVVEALLADLAEGLGPHTDDAGISFPFETLVVTATR